MDCCPEPLFCYVIENLFFKPIYALFISLLKKRLGQGEYFGAQQLTQQDIFWGEVGKKVVMKELYDVFYHNN